MDRYADHLYSDEEMEELIVNNQVWIQCEDNQITTIFVYKIEGKNFIPIYRLMTQLLMCCIVYKRRFC